MSLDSKDPTFEADDLLKPLAQQPFDAPSPQVSREIRRRCADRLQPASRWSRRRRVIVSLVLMVVAAAMLALAHPRREDLSLLRPLAFAASAVFAMALVLVTSFGRPSTRGLLWRVFLLIVKQATPPARPIRISRWEEGMAGSPGVGYRLVRSKSMSPVWAGRGGATVRTSLEVSR